MLENTFLGLSCHGYLYDVHHQDDKWYATFNVIQPLNNSLTDDVWLGCLFNMDKFPILTKLNHYLAKGKLVIVEFDAKYSGFQQCYAETPEEKHHLIVQIQGELLHVHEYYVEGVCAFYGNRHAMKNHRVLHKSCAHYKMEAFYG